MGYNYMAVKIASSFSPFNESSPLQAGAIFRCAHRDPRVFR